MSQQVTVESEVIANGTEIDIMDFTIQRTAEGCELYIKSNTLEKFFSMGGYREGSDMEWSGHNCYALIPSLDSTRKNLLNNWGANVLIISSDFPNLAFLRTKGLKDGVTFKLKSVHSRTEIAKFIKLFREHIKTLYLEFIKPVNCGVKLTTTITNGIDG